MLENVLKMVMPMLPLLKPKIPEFSVKMAEFVPPLIERIANEFNVNNVQLILETRNEEGVNVCYIRYVTIENGSYKSLVKEDGRAYVQRMNEFIELLLNQGIGVVNTIKSDDDE